MSSQEDRQAAIMDDFNGLITVIKNRVLFL